MRIFVNTGILLHDIFEKYHSFLNEALKIVINRNREHEFIVLSQDAEAATFFSAGNVAHVKMRNALRHALAVRMWYDLKLPSILKKYKADLFISFDGLCSVNTGIPQLIFFNDLPFLSDSTGLNRLRSIFYKRFMQKALHKANRIICCSDFRKKDVMLRYSVNADKLGVVLPAVKDSFQPLNEDVKERVRINYCDGKNYFAYTGTIPKQEELFNVLRAFSVFKKRQKSNWKLLLMGIPHQFDKKFMDSLASYKYRSDVVVIAGGDEDETARLIGSAYAVISAIYSEHAVFPLLQALKCTIPVITADTPWGREIAGDEALYFDPEDSNSIADRMMTIYKDEPFRDRLIEKGKAQAAKYSFDKSATLLWESISDAIAEVRQHGMD